MVDLEMKIDQARQRLRDLQTKAQKQKRRDETRRKIIYGSAALILAGQFTGEQREKFMKRLHDNISRETDRTFLGLAPAEVEKTFATKPREN